MFVATLVIRRDVGIGPRPSDSQCYFLSHPTKSPRRCNQDALVILTEGVAFVIDDHWLLRLESIVSCKKVSGNSGVSAR